MIKKILFSIILISIMFSVAQAGQITSHEIYFYEDSNEYRMGNGVIGLTAYKNKGSEQNKPTYFDNLNFETHKANEEIYLEQYSNGKWKKVNFAHYTAELNEAENTITKHYWNTLSDSLSITYELKDYSSPIKLSFELWGFYGTYRIQWRISDVNTAKVIDKDYKLAYINEATNNEEPTLMSDTPIIIDPPETTPEEYEFMIDYVDFIEAIGWDKVNIEQEYDEFGNITATNFLLGEFNLEFYETLYLDPQITSGHTVHQYVKSILNNGTSYYISVKGDFESGTDDGAYVLRTTNFSNASSWTKVVAMGGETAPRDNVLFMDALNILNFVDGDASLNLDTKNSSNGTSWSALTQVTTSAMLDSIVRSPKVQLMTNGISIFTIKDGNQDPRWVTYNATSKNFTVSSAMTATSINFGQSSFFNSVTNKTYIVWGYITPNVSFAIGSNFGTPSQLFNLYIGSDFNAPFSPQIHSYNGTLYLFYFEAYPNRIGYSTCPATSNCNTTSDWTTGNEIDSPYVYEQVYDSILSIENQGLILIPSTNLTTNFPIHILNNDTWFRLDGALNLTTITNDPFQYLIMDYYNSTVLMAYSDSPASYREVYSNEYILPDILVKVEDINGNTILTNQTINAYCDGSTLMKTTSTTTGSIAIYSNDSIRCLDKTTTIQLVQNNYQETNMTIVKPVAYYEMENNAYDTSGNSKTATVYGAVYNNTTYKRGSYSAQFDGVNDHFQIPVGTLVDGCEVTTGWTDSADCTTATSGAYAEGINSIRMIKEAGTSVDCYTSKEVTSNNFTNKALSFMVYINAITLASLENTGTALQIRYGNNNSNYYYWNFTKSEITKSIAMWFSIRDLTSTNANGTAGSPDLANMDYFYVNFISESSANTWNSTYPVYIDEIKIYNDTELNSIGAGTGDLTYSAWVYPASDGVATTYSLYDARDGTDYSAPFKTRGVNIWFTKAGLIPTIGMSDGVIALATSMALFTTPLTIDSWNHITIVIDKSEKTFYGYLNGNLDKTTTWTTDIGNINSQHVVKYGVDTIISNDFKGMLDEVIIYKTALSSSDIQTLYNTSYVTHEDLSGYTLTSGYNGWNITLNAGGCTSTSVPTAINNTSYCFNLFANNGTANTTKYCQVFNPNIVYTAVDINLYGSINMTIYPNTTTPTTYANKTFTTTRPTDSLIQINENVWVIDKFRARDRRASAQLTTFFMFANNSTTSTILNDSSTGWINTSLEYLPLGASTYKFSKTGYNDSYNSTTTSCSYILMNQSVEQAGLDSRVYDETTLAGLTYNMTVANTTNSTSFTALSNSSATWKNYTQIPNGAITITVSASGYENRQFYRTMSSTDYINLTGYLLSNTDGLIRSFNVVDGNSNSIPGATVTISLFINNAWTIVAEKITDASGVATFLMNPSYYYQVEATYLTMSSGVQEIQPTQSLYTLIMPLESTATQYSGLFSGVSYSVTPGGLWLSSSNNTTISYKAIASEDDMNNINMSLIGIFPDGNNSTIYTGNITGGSGGVLTTVIDTTNLTRVYGTFAFERDGYTTFTFQRNWIIDDMSAYQNISLMSALFGFANVPDDELSMASKSLIILVITTAIMGTLYFSVGGFPSGLIGVTIITVATIFGWFDYRGTILVWSIVLGVVFLQRGI